jgi:hypothetical protein
MHQVARVLFIVVGRSFRCHPCRNVRIPDRRHRLSSSLGRLPSRGPHQIRTRRFPPSGSSGDTARVPHPQMVTTTRGIVPLPSGVAGTCVPTSRHWTWFPPKARIPTGCLCSTESGLPPRSPASALVCSPPTPLRHRPRLRLSLAVGLPRRERFSEPAVRAFADARRVGGLGGWVLRCPSWIRGPSGASQVTGSSSSHAPRPNTPPGGGATSPCGGVVACCLQSS